MFTVSRRAAWITLGAVLACHIFLISIQINSRWDTSFLRIWLLDALAPAEKAVDRLDLSVSGAWHRYVNLIQVQSVNDKLVAENDSLKQELHRRSELEAENERLRLLVGVRDLGMGRPEGARIIGRDPSKTQMTVTIDRGQRDGIQRDTPVVTAAGVVGRVIHVGSSSALVQLLSDPRSGIGIIVRGSRRQGILRGTGELELEVDYIDDDNDIHVGQEMITSGLDRIYPKGYLVGVVTSVGARRGLLRHIRVRPFVDLGRIEEVVCLLDVPKVEEVPGPADPVRSGAR